MNNLRMTVEHDSGEACPIENIRIFQKHLQLFHKKGVTIHDENGHYFTVDNSFRQKIDTMVSDCLDNGLFRQNVMAISRPRRREKKLRREGTEKKREQKKDWTKKKIKEITEVVQMMADEEFEALPESLSETLKYLRK